MQRFFIHFIVELNFTKSIENAHVREEIKDTIISNLFAIK